MIFGRFTERAQVVLIEAQQESQSFKHGYIGTEHVLLGILKEKDANFTGADVRNGMTAVVAVKHPEPRFEGQTKTKLDNPDAGKVAAEITGEELVLYFDRNVEVLKNVIACAEKSAAICSNSLSKESSRESPRMISWKRSLIA